MGVLLTPIIEKRHTILRYLYGKSFAVDANHTLYQFLSVIRKPDGSPLTDAQGNVTSHLEGLIFRTSRLISELMMPLIFVFDGVPPKLKEKTLERRRSLRERAQREWREAALRGDYQKAFSKAVSSTRLDRHRIEEAKELLGYLGIPYVQAPSDAEAQAAYIAQNGDVWAVASRDYDSLLYGAPRLVRNLGIQATEFLPSKGRQKVLEPEIFELQRITRQLGISRPQLVDLAILVGTDFNEGLRGIGPKTALKLIRRYGSLESMPAELKDRLTHVQEVRSIFLQPNITDEYTTDYHDMDEHKALRFLCDEKGFSEERVKLALKRMRAFYSSHERATKRLTDWS